MADSWECCTEQDQKVHLIREVYSKVSIWEDGRTLIIVHEITAYK